MGVVYKARQVSVDRVIAIKMLNAQMARDPNWVQRFYNEAKVCSQLQHPNTIRMFDFGQTREGNLFISMEFLDGMSLRQAIAAGPMQPARVLKVLIQCCASLSEAHGIGVIHRDIKPDNVFLVNLHGSPDFVKVLDFSVAKLAQNDMLRTQAGIVFGTPQYMSPEQSRAVPLDARSDIYALGVLAYEMLTGRCPFSDNNPMAVLHMHISQPVPPLPQHIPPPVQAIVYRALEKEPARRFSSATEMMQYCQQALGQIGGSSTAQSPGVPTAPATPSPLRQGGYGAPPPGYGAPPPQGRTMVPDALSPFAQQGPPQGQMMPPPMGMGGPPQMGHPPMSGPPPMASPPPMAPPGGSPYGQQPQARTILADGMAQFGAQAAAARPQMQMPPQPQMQMPPMQPMQPQMQGRPQMQGGGGGDSPRTVMLENSEGVISFAKKGRQAKASSPGTQPRGSGATPSARGGAEISTRNGASPLFWIVCLITGLAIGLLAYLAVLKLGR